MKKFIFSILTLVTFNLAYSQTNDISSLLDKGIQLHDKGKFYEALSYYDIALSKSPDNVRILSEKALTLNSLGKHKDVVKICKKIFRLKKHSNAQNSVYLIWGNSLDELGEQMKAVDVYDEGISRFPASAQLYLNRGIMYTKVGKFENALADFEKTIIIDPYHSGGHNFVGRLNYHEHPIQSLLAFSRFLLIEYKGERAKEGLELFQSILKGKAAVQDGDSFQVNIAIPANLAEEIVDSKKNNNNFSQVEIQLSLLSSLEYSDEFKNKDEYDQMAMKLDHLIDQLERYSPGKRGFYWEYYVSYFIDLKKNGYLELFTHLIHLPEEKPENIKWLAENENMLDAFYNWDKNFKWASF